MIDAPASVPMYPRVDFPDDPGLPGLPTLFDPEWVCSAYRESRPDDTAPHRIKVHQFSYVPSRSALVGYVLEWHPGEYIPSRYFTARIQHGRPVTTFPFPHDDGLPGLTEASDPEGVVRLANKHILAIPPRRAHVETVRYRPGNRAVLRHKIGRAKLFARVVRPAALPGMLEATALVRRSRFVVPRIAGYWQVGGTLWLSEMPGENLRQCIRRGAARTPACSSTDSNPYGPSSPKKHAAPASTFRLPISGLGLSSDTLLSTVQRFVLACERPPIHWTPSSRHGSQPVSPTTTSMTTRCWFYPTAESRWWTWKKPAQETQCSISATSWPISAGHLAFLLSKKRTTAVHTTMPSATPLSRDLHGPGRTWTCGKLFACSGFAPTPSVALGRIGLIGSRPPLQRSTRS